MTVDPRVTRSRKRHFRCSLAHRAVLAFLANLWYTVALSAEVFTRVMTAEILSIGTELLLGQTVDTDSAFLGRSLAALGINLYRKGTVGDNFERVVTMIREARDRADLLVLCGGLGPTEDDLTKEA